MKYGFPMIVPVAIERLVWRILRCWDFVRSRIICWTWGLRGRNISFQGRTFVRAHHRGEITIGDYVIFNSRFSTNPVGLTGPTFLDTRPGGRITIGNHSGFSSVVISSMSSVMIGANVKAGGNVRVFDHDFHAVGWRDRRYPENRAAIRTSPIVIEDDVFIGTNSIILKGTHIGARSIIAAGSVVFGLQVPEDCLVKGNPAEIIKRK